jgi:tetratricopeptide (TPR) repeat protein
MEGTGQASDIERWHREAERALNARDYRRSHELCIRILERAPQFPDALFLLGMIAAEHSNFGKAEEVIQRALRLDPQRADYHAHLGRCLIALDRPRAAMEAAFRALELQPHDALTLDTVGVVLTRAGAHREALEPFRKAVALASDNAAFVYNLGAALQFSGDFAGAETAFRRCLALDERYFRAWSGLAQVARQLEATDVSRLEAALELANDPDEELNLCHALARHCEDMHDYERSYALLARGKRRKRAVLAPAPFTDQELFAAARETCTRQFLSARAPADTTTEPIFIVGMPRTGTTLVERILSSHPGVFAAGELANFGVAVKRAAATRSRFVLDPDTLRAAATLDFTRLGMEYLDSTRPRTGRTLRFIDKMPLNFLYAGLISRALPNARIICLRRNPLDTCLSNYRQLFATGFAYYNYAYDLLETGQYFLEFDALARHWRESIVANYCEVSYEAIVEDTEAQARRLIDFCGLEWDPACLAFHKNAAPVATASSVQVRQPIYKTSINRWKNYERQIAPLRDLLTTAGLNY